MKTPKQFTTALFTLLTLVLILGLVGSARSVDPAPAQTWLLLHGIWPGSGWNWQKTAYWLKQSEQTGKVFIPTLNGRAGLYKWADNITIYAESQKLLTQETQIHLVSHSFGAAATLFLLRTVYELTQGDLSVLIAKLDCNRYWGNALSVCKELMNGWEGLLSDEKARARWIATAQKIKTVTLYHPALQGACGACVDVLGVAGRTSGALCLLEKIAAWLWYPIEHLTWDGEKRILNLYGAMTWSVSLCGFTSNDIALNLQQQKLYGERLKNLSSECLNSSYTEIDAGAYSHISFIHRWNVAKELVERILQWQRTPIGANCPKEPK